VGAIRLRQPTGHRRLEPGPVAEALLPLLADDIDEGVALAEKSFGVFQAEYETTWSSGMRAKLGLPADVPAEVLTLLVDELLRLLQESRVDYTSFFRHLGGRGPWRHRTTRAWAVHRPRRLRRVDVELASLGAGCRDDGSR